MLQFIDTHIHLQDFKPDFAPQVLKNSATQKLILIATRPADFPSISSLIKAHPQKLIGAFGVHPWYKEVPFSIEELKQKLIEFPNALIGEIGVDELREKVNEKQHKLFSAQLEIARNFSRPVIVHAAKAFPALMEHETELKQVKYVHHGFVKNQELLKFIIRTGGYIGLGALFLKQEKAAHLWEMMPKDKILFETDAPYRIDEKNYNNIVQENLKSLALISGMGQEALSNLLTQNAQKFIDVYM